MNAWRHQRSIISRFAFLIVKTPKKQWILTPKLVQISRLMTLHWITRIWKDFLFTWWHFLSRVGRSSKSGSKRFWEHGNERLIWGFYMVMGWNWNKSSHKAPDGTKRRNTGTCQLWSRKGRGRVRHESYQQSNIKTELNSFVYVY